MNRVLLLLPCLLLLGTGCASPVTNTLHPSHDELTFYPDGIVMETASNPGAKVSEDGIVTLLFEERGNEISGHNGLATADASSDWLSFTITDENADIGAFRAVQLPDGTYRTLMMDSTKGTRVGESVEGFLSESSDDGIAFTPDEGYRYLLQPEDNGSVGVYELFVNASDEVILLYIGDKQGDNTVRRAVSYDGGWTFEFDRFNVLGDQAFERHSDKYVDEKILSLGDGRWRLITMASGSLHTFISEDDGYSFEYEAQILSPQDFAPQYDLMSLNDPQMVQLPDGRFRIYVTGIEAGGDSSIPGGTDQHIFSATTRLDE